MTKRDVIEAFVRGDIDRRVFVLRLTAFGVSASAAATYAATLGQSAVASPSRNSAGFLVRAQADEEYGTAFVFASVEEALTTALSSLSALNSALLALENFTADDFASDVFATLSTISEQQQEHEDALTALLGQAGGDTAKGVVPASRNFAAPGQLLGSAVLDLQDFASPEEFLDALVAAFDELTAVYGAVVPAIEDGESRQAMMNIAGVANRQAAIINDIAGVDPFPETFQTPALP